MTELPPERALIAELTRGVSPVLDAQGLQGDCAVVALGTTDLVASVDGFAAPTHFPPGTPPHMMGRFAVSAALSDLAAAGADPLGVLVAYGLPGDLSLEDARAIAGGVLSALDDHGGELLGGDTKPRPVLELVVTALGHAPPGKALSRAEARPGETVYVTGPLGGAGAALDRLEQGLDPAEAAPLLDPVPRLRAGRALRSAGVRCCMDLSDGLADGAVAIAEASEVGVTVEADQVPLHPWARAGSRGLGHALSTGGDYELLFTAGPDAASRALQACHAVGVEPVAVGRVHQGHGAVLDRGGERTALERGYEHGFASTLGPR